MNGFDFDVTFPALQSPSINKIPEGGTFSVTVTTTAANATYEWYNPGSSSPINTTILSVPAHRLKVTIVW